MERRSEQKPRPRKAGTIFQTSSGPNLENCEIEISRKNMGRPMMHSMTEKASTKALPPFLKPTAKPTQVMTNSMGLFHSLRVSLLLPSFSFISLLLIVSEQFWSIHKKNVISLMLFIVFINTSKNIKYVCLFINLKNVLYVITKK